MSKTNRSALRRSVDKACKRIKDLAVEEPLNQDAIIGQLELLKLSCWTRRPKIQDLRRQLRERFTAEYLGQLKLKHSRKPEHRIKVGDIVLIGDDNVKRTDWPIARIVALVRGNDNHVRVVKLKTRSGILTRPIQRVYPLEISSNGDYCVSENVGTDESDMTNNGTSEIDVIRDTHRIKQTDYGQASLEQVGQIVKVDSKQPSPIKANITRVGRNVKKPIKLDL
ncbi:uncharacterized protein LOC103522804 [Diaphorina citri]|uniref:Uncharacterized protein LOC103522804 n=1 Tax=Diaphorina citri TaxID=121845 RepID=A0A1S3DQZ6_DIACI|nr:uncharacterized protein LOC103522804 [Diaphorina citri]